MLGVLRCAPSACALAFGVPRFLTSSSIHRSGPPTAGGCLQTRAVLTSFSRQLSTQPRTVCLWAAVTQAVPETSKVDPGVEEIEDELDALVSESEDGDGEEDPSEGRPSPARLSLLQSHVNILEQDCGVAQALIDAARSRAGKLYLGLDVSTQSTGYAVLRPSTVPPSTSEPEGLLREAGEANLVEWGCILGSSNGSKKDVVDVGIIVEEALVEVATRCRRDNGYNGRDRELSAEQGVGADGASGLDVAAAGRGWVVGVEDFMRRFLPGRSNARSIIALAQLNGIVKYACQKHLGTKADSFHPSTARSFYGLMQNKPEGKDMKQIVHDFALSQENGALESRFEWPLSLDGSKADGSYDVTDAYLVARYSWHRDVFKAVAGDNLAKDRFAKSFQALHADKLLAAEERSLKLFMEGDMPAARGKKKLKPMTERSARNAHRKLEDMRVNKAYETALLHWFKKRVLGAGL